MRSGNKIKEQRIGELVVLRQQLAGFEKAESERKQMAKQLRESEERYRDLYEEAPIAYFSVDTTGRIRMANHSAEELLGYQLYELIGQPVLNLYADTASGKPKAQEIFQRFVAGEQIQNQELEMVKKNGSRAWVSLSVRPVKDAKGEVVASRSVVLDITERKQAEEQFENIFNLSPDMVGVFTTEGRLIRVNPSWETILGYKTEELFEMGWATLVHPDDVERTNKEVEEQLKGSHIVDFVNRYKCKDGSYKTLEWRATFAKGGIVHATARDITERKQMEAQLLQSQKMEAIGVLASGVAHDFNNLLTAILGYSQLVLDDLGDNKPLRKKVEEIKDAGERAAALTRQLLAFSRQEVLQPEILDLDALVTNIEKMLRRLIGEDIELLTVLEPKLKSIKADPGQIEQVIMNLVVNARDAMPEGGKITIRTENITVEEEYCKFHPDAKAGEFVSLMVEDTGAGIDKEVIRHIFEPFFTTKERDKGTGLGLSVVYGIMRQHGGWINAYSEPGQGATLRAYLPAISEEVEDETKEGVPIEQLKGSDERILVVEDEAGVREFVARVLGENGYVSFGAANAREALDIFKREQGRFHMVFSDVVLPGKNGLELVVQLLSLKPRLPVLMTSGYTDHKAHWPLIQERGFGFLQKPFSIINLLQAMKEAIEQAKQ